MRYSSPNRGLPAGNPIASALVVIVGTLAIAASILLGFLAFVVLGSILLVIAGIVGVRIWWFNRQLRTSAGARRSTAASRDVPRGAIEGEYHIVDRDGDDSS